MSSNLGVGKTLELLERLRGTVREFAARAEKLNAEFQARTGREQRLREAAAEKQAQELAAAVRRGRRRPLRRPGSRGVAKYEARKARIGKAYQASKEKGLADIETQTGTRKYELQKKMLQAERDRDAGLAAGGDGARGVQSQPGGGAGGAGGAGSGCSASRSGAIGDSSRLLAEAYQKAAPPDAAQDENQLLAELRELLGKASGDLGRFRKFLLLRVFKYLPLWVLLVLGEVPLVLWTARA